MGVFESALQFVLKSEGGYSDHKFDRGGATNKGITQNNYDSFRRAKKLPIRSVKDIADDEVSEIYRSMFWDTARCGRLPAQLALVHFDSAVQHGPRRAVKFLQQALDTPSDGVWGGQTEKALGKIDDTTVRKYMDIRHGFYDRIIAADSTQSVFAKGWDNRMTNLQSLLVTEAT